MGIGSGASGGYETVKKLFLFFGDTPVAASWYWTRFYGVRSSIFTVFVDTQK
jgi:hypothetical protein